MNTPLNPRACEILSHVVEAYVDTGEPVGSKTLSARLGMGLSSATIRNVMADLERLGLLYAPHTSAGRLPTAAGLRYFVHGLLEMGQILPDEAATLRNLGQQHVKSYDEVLDTATSTLSGLARCAGLVIAPKHEEAVKHLEFVRLSDNRALVVLVLDSGMVENRLIEIPEDVHGEALAEAGRYLSQKLQGKTLAEVMETLAVDLQQDRASLQAVSANLIETGMALWGGDQHSHQHNQALIIRGQANLLQDVTAVEDLDRVRKLFTALEAKSTYASLLHAAQQAEGVQIFIGAENELFNVSGCTVIVAPFRNTRAQVVGAIGVVGPSRVNYGRVIPMVDYTAKVMTRMLSHW